MHFKHGQIGFGCTKHLNLLAAVGWLGWVSQLTGWVGSGHTRAGPVENSATVVVVLAEGRVHVHGRRRRAAAARSRRRSPLGRRRAICQFGQTCVGSAVSRNSRQLSVVFNRRYRLYNTHTHTRGASRRRQRISTPTKFSTRT